LRKTKGSSSPLIFDDDLEKKLLRFKNQSTKRRLQTRLRSGTLKRHLLGSVSTNGSDIMLCKMTKVAREICMNFTLRLNLKIKKETLTVSGSEFQYSGPTTLRDELLVFVLAK